MSQPGLHQSSTSSSQPGRHHTVRPALSLSLWALCAQESAPGPPALHRKPALLNTPQQTAQKTCVTQHTTTNCTENLRYSTHHNKLWRKPAFLNTPKQTEQKTCVTQHTTRNCTENPRYSTH